MISLILWRNYKLFDLFLLRITTDWVRIDDIRLQVEDRWEVHLSFIFFLADNTFLLEPLEMQNQHFRSPINAHFFCCQLMLLAIRAVPLISRFKLFSLTQCLKTVRNINRSIISVSTDFMLFCKVIKVFKLLKRKEVTHTLRKSDIKLTIFFIQLLQNISKNIFVSNWFLFFKFVLKSGIESIKLFPEPKS